MEPQVEVYYKKEKDKKKDLVSELEEKCAELNEKYLYALAQMRDLHKTYEKENAIAVKYGGGGHLKASGATLKSREEAMQMLNDLNELGEN